MNSHAEPLKTKRRSSERIAEHAAAHRLPAVHVVLHGGEPLLAGLVLLRRAATSLRAALAPDCALDLRIHTNGVRLDREFCELFDELDIKVGISLDGDKAANDRHRRYADGRSSHRQALAARARRAASRPPRRAPRTCRPPVPGLTPSQDEAQQHPQGRPTTAPESAADGQGRQSRHGPADQNGHSATPRNRTPTPHRPPRQSIKPEFTSPPADNP